MKGVVGLLPPSFLSLERGERELKEDDGDGDDEEEDVGGWICEEIQKERWWIKEVCENGGFLERETQERESLSENEGERVETHSKSRTAGA